MGFCSMISVCVVLARSAHLTGGFSKNGAWRQYIRPLLFILGFLLVYAFALVGYLNGHIYTDDYHASVVSYVRCLLGPNGSTTTCGVHPENRPTIFLWRGLHVALAGQGLIVFAIYGSHGDNFVLWYHAIRGGVAMLTGKPYRGTSTSYAHGTNLNSSQASRAVGAAYESARNDDFALQRSPSQANLLASPSMRQVRIAQSKVALIVLEEENSEMVIAPADRPLLALDSPSPRGRALEHAGSSTSLPAPSPLSAAAIMPELTAMPTMPNQPVDADNVIEE
jgi:hypothetical protein